MSVTVSLVTCRAWSLTVARGFGLTFSTAGHTDRETKWDKSKLQCQRGCHNQTSDSTVNKNSKQHVWPPEIKRKWKLRKERKHQGQCLNCSGQASCGTRTSNLNKPTEAIKRRPSRHLLVFITNWESQNLLSSRIKVIKIKLTLTMWEFLNWMPILESLKSPV